MPTLPNLSVLPPEAPDTALSKLNVTDGVLRAVSQVLPFPQQPAGQFHGEMPNSVVGLEDDQLGDLLLKAGEWASYVEFELAKADAQRNAAEHQLKFMQASVRLSLKSDQLTGKKLTVGEKDDMMTTDPRIVDAQSRAIFAEAYFQMMKVIHNKAQRNWDTISRRITQRGQQVERAKREHSVANIPAQPARAFRRPT